MSTWPLSREVVSPPQLVTGASSAPPTRIAETRAAETAPANRMSRPADADVVRVRTADAVLVRHLAHPLIHRSPAHRQVLGSAEASLTRSGRLFDASGPPLYVRQHSLKRWICVDGIKPDSGRAAVPARACALAVLRRVFEDGAWADRALHGEARRLGLDARERALAMRLAYGAVQRRATLDHLIETLAGRPVERLEPLVLAALRLGLYQLAYADRVPAHAAVGESVELVKRGSPGRREARQRRAAARRARGRGAASPRSTTPRPPQAALRHSHPEWIAALWWDALGPDAARALMAADNEPAETALRVNTLRADPAELAARLPVAVASGARPARGARARGPVRRVRLAGVGAGRLHAAVARGDDGRAAARAAPGRARARPVRRPRRQDDAPGRPDGGLRRRSWPSSATPGARTRCAAPPPAWAPTSRSAPAMPPRPQEPGALRPRPGRPAVLGPRHARVAARRALAQAAGPARAARARAGRDPARRAPTRCGPAARSSTRPARSRPPRTRPSCEAFLAERGDFGADDLRSDVPLWDA